MESYKEIVQLIASAEADVAKFEKGNASAGRRIRKALLAIGKLSKVARKEIQEALNAE